MGLTFGNENKAQLHLDLAEERSEEIQTLVEEGNLEAANDIGVELTNHLEKAQTVAPGLLESGEIVARLETIANRQVVLLEAIYDRAPTGAQETIDTLIKSINDAYEIINGVAEGIVLPVLGTVHLWKSLITIMRHLNMKRLHQLHNLVCKMLQK